MEALTEPGVLPHSHHPASPHGGIYHKQDSGSFYFPSSSPNRSGCDPYPGYPQVSEGESWMGGQQMGQHNYLRYPDREAERHGEKEGATVSYFPPANSQPSSHQLMSPFHHQVHQPSHFTSSSLHPYPQHFSSSKASKQKGNNQTLDDGNIDNDPENSVNSSHGPEKVKICLNSPFDKHELAGNNHTSVINDKTNLSHFWYNKYANLSGGHMDKRERDVFKHQGFLGEDSRVKDIYPNDKISPTLISKSKMQAARFEEKQMTEGENKNIVYNEDGERTEGSPLYMSTTSNMTSMLWIDKDRQSSHGVTSEPSVCKKEMRYTTCSSDVDFCKVKDRSNYAGLNDSQFTPEKSGSVKGESAVSSSKDRQNRSCSDIVHSAQNAALDASPDNNHLNGMNHQYYHMTSHSLQHQSQDGLRSPSVPRTDHSHQSNSQSDSTLFGIPIGKSLSCPPPVKHIFNSEAPPWRSPSPSALPQSIEQFQKEDFKKDYPEPGQITRKSREITEYKKSPKLLGNFPYQLLMSPDHKSSFQTSQNRPVNSAEDASSDSPKELPSSQGVLDGIAKANISDGSENGRVDTKREVFSDEDDEDDSTCEDSASRSPASSPFNDASMPYPHHFPHPFFSPQVHGPLSSLRFQFGSPQGPHTTTPIGPGFPFSHVPNMTPDMALVGHMPPARPPFTDSVGLVRQMSGEKDIFFCHLCNYSGKSKAQFDNHMNIHFEFNCPHCDYTSRTEGRLKRHIKDFHSEDSSRRSMPGRPKVHKCKQCPFSTTEKDKFWAHSRTHIKEDKLLQCPKCPFVTEYKHHLEYHLRNHFGSKPFKCVKCNYSCVNKSMLNSHMKSHTNVYQYRCSECTYATKYCHSLKLHLKKYNHKPATVLNQDGSLPQGLDVESSGLSTASKRGPPRGPRGIRKDKSNPFMSHLFEMPLGVSGMSPVLNGMMPFWPVMPGMPGYPPPEPGMLPEIRNLARHFNMSAGCKEAIDDSKLKYLDNDGRTNNEEGNGYIKDKDHLCKLCSFTADSSEALGLHLMKMHKEEAKEVAISCGFSEKLLDESFKRISSGAKLDHQQISESQMPDSVRSSREFSHTISDVGALFQGRSESLQFQTDKMADSSTAQPALCPKSSYIEDRIVENGRHDSLYPLKVNNSRDVNESFSSPGGVDILQQMTLKFGPGAVPDQQNSPAVREDNQNKGNNYQESSRKFVSIPRFCQTPLDLTKPKSDSPPTPSNSPKGEDEDSDRQAAEEGKRSLSTGEVTAQSNVTETVTKKRPNKENEDTASVCDVSSDMSPASVPRKRSRKGRAYKLDTLCLKLRKRQVSTSHDDGDDGDDDDDEPNLNMEVNLHYFKSLQSAEEDDKDKSELDQFSISRTDKAWKHSGSYGQGHRMDNKDDNATEGENEQEKTDFSIMLENDEKTGAANGKQEISEKHKDNRCEETAAEKGDKMSIQDEAELELQKLQRSLNILDEELDSERPDSVKLEINKEAENLPRDDDFDIRNNHETDDDNYKSATEEQTVSDKEGTAREAVFTDQVCHKSCRGNKLDQVDMINTVIENRKKPVPPAIRRGTDLAWKLLHDPVNPVTSLPLPLDIHPPPMTSKMPSLAQNSAPVADFVKSSMVVKNEIKPLPLPPQYSHSHLRHPHISQTHLMHSPQSHNLHNPPSLVSMKPLMPLSIPSTPMAYIPPTNRMMPDAALIPTDSRMKPSQKELYECTYCDLSFRDCVMYTVHMGYHSNQNPFQCNGCGVVSRDKVEFFLHIARSPHS